MSESPTESPSADTESVADRQRAFVTDYLSTVTSDPRSSFEMLTPAFQSGERRLRRLLRLLGHHRLRDARSRSPPTRRATRSSYTVDYEMADGSSRSDDVTLQLVESDGQYLIADEF